ncbi:MAG: hypothetical protein DRP56_02115 [Planctomycetota bacterium]|nr:MAG: hypothetical protein DRP56_02115 [Planctomycetota bacterium]
MISETVADTIRSRFKTQIADGQSLPTQYDNEGGFTKPNAAIWGRLSIVDGDTDQADIGSTSNRRYRTVGILYAQLFIPLSKGDKALRVMAGHIETAFRGLTAGNIHYGTPKGKPMGRDGNYWAYTVRCPFYFDEIG